jgi:AcrR family transcriptional regulator
MAVLPIDRRRPDQQVTENLKENGEQTMKRVLADGNVGVSQPRRRGRPRLLARATEAREEILEAAGRLFTTQGYAGTGTREIAAAVGLEQSSLFHWFARKEDILAELLERTIAPALAASELLNVEDAPPEARLFALARRDVTNLCSGPVNLAALQLLPEARNRAFAQFWDRREELKRRYGRIVAELSEADQLAVPDPGLATDLVFGLVESVITWFERGGRTAVDEAADEVAASAVRMTVSRPIDIETIRRISEGVTANPPVL